MYTTRTSHYVSAVLSLLINVRQHQFDGNNAVVTDDVVAGTGSAGRPGVRSLFLLPVLSGALSGGGGGDAADWAGYRV